MYTLLRVAGGLFAPSAPVCPALLLYSPCLPLSFIEVIIRGFAVDILKSVCVKECLEYIEQQEKAQEEASGQAGAAKTREGRKHGFLAAGQRNKQTKGAGSTVGSAGARPGSLRCPRRDAAAVEVLLHRRDGHLPPVEYARRQRRRRLGLLEHLLDEGRQAGPEQWVSFRDRARRAAMACIASTIGCGRRPGLAACTMRAKSWQAGRAPQGRLASEKCSGAPAPLLAMTGMVTAPARRSGSHRRCARCARLDRRGQPI